MVADFLQAVCNKKKLRAQKKIRALTMAEGGHGVCFSTGRIFVAGEGPLFSF
jgi:hypothetical protein